MKRVIKCLSKIFIVRHLFNSVTKWPIIGIFYMEIMTVAFGYDLMMGRLLLRQNFLLVIMKI